MLDGDSAILLSSPESAKAHGLTPRERIVMTAMAGTEPVIMLTAPRPASELAVNEAFAVVSKFLRDSEVDPDQLNVAGGAIALV